MTVRLSTGIRNAMLDGGTGKGVKGSLAAGFMAILTGSQPATADAAATGTLLGTVSVNGAGTGTTFDAAVAGVLSKAAAEVWRFTGLAAGIAGWFRCYPAGDTITNISTTATRIDGATGSSGADVNLTNLNIAVSQVNTVDTFTITLPTA